MSDLVKTEDLEQLKEIMEDEFGALVTLFIDDSAKLIKDMQSAYETGDSDAIRVAAHTLKGSAGNMCAVGLTDICKEIEDKAKNNDLQGMDSLIAKLNELYPPTCELLTAF